MYIQVVASSLYVSPGFVDNDDDDDYVNDDDDDDDGDHERMRAGTHMMCAVRSGMRREVVGSQVFFRKSDATCACMRRTESQQIRF